MIYCHNCGTVNEARFTFCRACGAALHIQSAGGSPAATSSQMATTQLSTLTDVPHPPTDTPSATSVLSGTTSQRLSGTSVATAHAPRRGLLVAMVAAGALIIGAAGGLGLRELGLLDAVLGRSLSEAEFGSRLTTETAAAETKGYGLGLDRGYDRGYEAGVADGYEDGLKNGYDEGFNEGSANVATASNSAYDDGFSDGKTEGYSSGLSDGKKQGYDDGFYEGCVSVFDSLSSDAAVGFSVSSRKTGTFYITQSQTC